VLIAAIITAVVLLSGGLLVFAFRDAIFNSGSNTPAASPSGPGVYVPPPQGPQQNPPQQGPQQDPPPPPGNPPGPGQQTPAAMLEGQWGNGSGDLIHHFILSDNIIFTLTSETGGRVYEDWGEEWGDWWIDSDGDLNTYGDDYEEHNYFIFMVNETTLTLVDVDGDVRTYTRR